MEKLGAKQEFINGGVKEAELQVRAQEPGLSGSNWNHDSLVQ